LIPVQQWNWRFRQAFLSCSSIPPADLRRSLVAGRSNDQNLPHIGLVGDPYAILQARKDMDGCFCLIDMHILPGGGPPPTDTTLRSPSSFSSGYLSRSKVGCRCRRDHSYSCQGAPPVSKQERPIGRSAVHPLSCRAGRVLCARGRTGCNPDERAAKTRWDRSGGAQSESGSARTEV
jgi:hypothetical protein